MGEIFVKKYKVPFGEKLIEVFKPNTKEQEVSSSTLPKVLYKYRDWEDEYQKLTLTERQIYLASPILFNDPFDCKIPFDFEKLKDEGNRRKYFTEILRGLNNGYGKDLFTDAHIEEHVAKFKFDKNFNTQTASDTFYKDFISNLGIFCTTPHNDSILMWCHYAKNATGFCVGFNTEKLLQYDSINSCISIDYLNQLDVPKVDITKPSKDRIEGICFRKFGIWEYEHEHRFLSTYPRERIINLLPHCIHSVILGSAMKEAHKQEIKGILNKPSNSHIKLFQAKQSGSKFELEINEISKV